MLLHRVTNIFVFACCLLLLLTLGSVAYAQEEGDDPKGEIFIEANPGHKNAIFSENGSIAYKLKVKSTYDVRQDGKVIYELLTDDWKKVWSGSTPVRLGKNGSGTYNVRVPQQKPGVYRLHFALNLSYYDDTVRRVAVVSPEKIVTESHMPGDFDSFWAKAKDQLGKVKPEYVVTEDVKQSTRDVKVYKVEMRSLDNVKIRGWLTVPTEGKNWPVIYKLPGYNIPMKPETDKPDFAVFAIDVRGNGMSRDVFAPQADRYNVTNIENHDRYIYRGVYMDCIRGLDFIMSHADLGLNTSKVAVLGGSQGATLAIVVAALDKRVTACTFELPLYADMHDAYHIGTSFPKTTWPVNRFQDYLKIRRGSFTEAKFLAVWDYYDPQNFASKISCPVLMGVGLLDEFCPPRCSFGMYNKLTTYQKEFRVAPDKAHEMNFDYFMFQLLWLKESLRVPN